MSAPAKAVFLSYASQDADAARRICDALRAAGVEVWFDQSELVGGDTWDAKIREQIKECALFVPIISASTQSRLEGYFRLEWRLAAQRTHTMADERAFLLPLVIDATRDGDALVPTEFRAVQWTRVSDGNPSETFCTRVRALIGLETGVRAPSRTDLLDTRGTPVLAATRSSTSAGFPAGKSIAVLAFANLSHDPENEYFSDGISEELLNVLAKIPGLRVTARTSSFYFKGRNLPVPEIAQKLGVSYVVEGSVRRAGTRVRITAQLIDAVEDAHLWSDSFDRELKDIFAVQDEIAGLIAQNLELTLGAARKVAKTVDPEAYELCLQGRRCLLVSSDEALARAEQLFGRALQFDPTFAPAAAGLAQVTSTGVMLSGWAARHSVAKLDAAERRAREALRLDSTLGDTHSVLGAVALQRGALLEAGRSYGRAVELRASYEHLAASMLVQFRLRMGRPDLAVIDMERAYQLDPFSWLPADLHGFALLHAGRPADACASLRHAETLGTAPMTRAHHALALAKLGHGDEAIARAQAIAAPAIQRGWSAGLVAASEALAAWGLALAGAENEARATARRLANGPLPLRWTAGFPLLALREVDEGCAHLVDIAQSFVGPLLSLLYDTEALQSYERCIRLLEQLGAVAEFETFKRVRRGEKLE